MIHLQRPEIYDIFRMHPALVLSVNIFNITIEHMKIIVPGIVGLIIITTVMFAQNLDKEKGKATDTIEYIKRETLGGKLDFRSVLESPGEVITHDSGVRFNKNDYYVFLWGEAVSDMGLGPTSSASNLWEHIHGKKLTGPQRTALKIGYEKKLK